MSAYLYDASEITAGGDFCGAGGDALGWSLVDYLKSIWAANHWDKAIETHQANFPDAEHYCGDIKELNDRAAIDVTARPHVDFKWDSPACPPWSNARGKRVDFDKQTRQRMSLFDDEDELDGDAEKKRLLMDEVIAYLRAQHDHGTPVLAGVVENVVQCRLWADWDRWIGEIRQLGYEVRIIAFNSMHAVAPRSRRAPQSRDRLYVAYWHRKLGRTPDWDKWLRPRAYCPACDATIDAVQVFKDPTADMGTYGAQYIFVCPRTGCGREVSPDTVPALAAIDPTIPAQVIGERARPYAPATIDRLRTGIRRYWLPLLVPSGGTWRDQASPLGAPMPARTATESDSVALPPLLVPVEGRDGKRAMPGNRPMRTQTARAETAHAQLELPMFITPMSGGGDLGRARPVTEPMHTIRAGGNHHGIALPPLVMRNFTPRSGDGSYLTTPLTEPMRAVTAQGNQSVITYERPLMVPYYGNADSARPADQPIGTMTARDRYAVARLDDFADVDIETLILMTRMRMLQPKEVRKVMAFPYWFRMMAKTKRDQVRLYGNAVTPPVAELLGWALVETIVGEEFERYPELVAA